MSIIINKMSENGRELAIVFRCARCGDITMLPFAQVVRFHTEENSYAHDVAHLNETQLPDGWQDHYKNTVFCNRCAADYERFMQPPAKVKEG